MAKSEALNYEWHFQNARNVTYILLTCKYFYEVEIRVGYLNYNERDLKPTKHILKKT